MCIWGRSQIEHHVSVRPLDHFGRPFRQIMMQVALVLPLTTVVTMDTSGILQGGRLLIRNGQIKAVVRDGEAFPPDLQPRDAQVIKTDGYIFPGFVNLHTHMSYNFQPLWVTDRHYKNRYEWQKYQPHIQAVMMPKWIIHGKWEYNLLTDTLQ